MAALRGNPQVDWQAVAEAHESWHERSQGLTPAASAVLMLATTAVLSGTPLGGLFQSVAGSLATTAAGTTNAALAAAVNAGLTALTSQAVHAVAANGGDLGAALDQLGSSGTLRALATAIATAGLTTSVSDALSLPGTPTALVERVRVAAVRATISGAANAAINGGDLDDAAVAALTSVATDALGGEVAERIGAAYRSGDLNYVAHKLAHAALGCAVGAARGDCAAGAVGGAVGEIAAEAYVEGWFANRLSDPDAFLALVSNPEALAEELADLRAAGVDIARLGGALAAFAAGVDVDAASEAAGNAAENNAACLGVCILATLTAVAVVLEVADKGVIAWDVYQLARAIERGDEARASELATELAIVGGVEAVVGLIPGLALATKVVLNLRKRGYDQAADRLEELTGTSGTNQQVADSSGGTPGGGGGVGTGGTGDDNRAGGDGTGDGGNNGFGGGDGVSSFPNPADRSDWPELSGMLRDAKKGKGNFGIGSGTREQAQAMGEAWVGPGFKVARDGRTLISADGLRQYRPPTSKPNSPHATTGVQANFEHRAFPSGNWTNNAHLNVMD